MGHENSGRRPQPTALKMLRGNPSKTRLNPHEPKPPAGPVGKPAELSASAGVVWDELTPICLAMGTLTTADIAPFATLCELEATRRQASAEKSVEGFTLFMLTTSVDSAGTEHVNVKVHPAIKLEGDTAVKLRPYYALFGLEPVSRARIAVPKAKDEPVSKWAAIQ